MNEKITAREVRLVSEDGAELLSVRDAIAKAQEADLDLVEISPNATPPVCKIIDYKKFLFEQKKRQKELKSKQTKVVVKEIRMGPNTEEHDFNFKLNHAKTFLQEGAKVKAYVFFKGRTIVFKDRGEILLLKFAQELDEFGSLEQMPKLEGKKMIMMINPKKK
ncbi:translation initiation factor IF-3 [Crocinitomix sp.]|nr:translation initiation factor IF-3 [Crocinitomix sp.]